MNKKLNIFGFVFAGAVGASLGFGEFNDVEAATSAKVNADSLTVRSGASVNYKAIDYLNKNDNVTIVSDYGDFSKVSYGNNKVGYVNDRYLTVINTVSSSNVYKVNTASLNVRSTGNASAKILVTIKKGTNVTVLSSSGTWWKVKVGNTTGFVNSKYISKVNATATTSQSSFGTYTVNTTSLNVRSAGDATSKILTTIKKGSTVSVLSSSGTWWKIKVGNVVGYVNSSYLTKSSSTTTPNNTTPTTDNTYRMYVNTGSLNVRSAGNATSPIVTALALNTAVTVLDDSKSWFKIKVGNTTGYVNSAYLGKSTTSTSNNNSTVVSSALKGKVIVLDPGHGGKFAGAQGFVHEEDVNLQIALKTKNYLQSKGATVVMTRTSDVHLNAIYDNDLLARSNVANNKNASLFISIHANAGGGTGTEVYYHNSSRGDQKLAQEIVTEISSSTGLKNRGAKKFSYAVIRSTKSSIPSVLIETGFVDTKNDASIIGSASGQDKIANAITKGVLDYYGK